MEFAVVNNYMGPVATKAMKGYSDEDLREAIDEFKVRICVSPSGQLSLAIFCLSSLDRLSNRLIRKLIVRCNEDFDERATIFVGIF